MEAGRGLSNPPSGIVRAWAAALVVAFGAFGAPSLAADGAPGPSARLTGSELVYMVTKSDSLTSIGARFGVEVAALTADNGLTPRSRLSPGQPLRVDARHLTVSALPEWGVVVNVPQRFLFYAEDGAAVFAFPVAVGKTDWKTPTGDFQIATKERHPVWVVPSSIQAEMRRLGTRVLTRVEPGPDNPLGDFWMGLSSSGCGIHATNAPASIYGFRTHGCIRLHPDDARQLFERVAVGLPVSVVYEPVLLAKTEDGAIWLEVHRDRYRQAPDPVVTARTLAADAGIESEIDWAIAERVIAMQEGSPRRVGRIDPIPPAPCARAGCRRSPPPPRPRRA